ncbi:Glycosyltransferase, GT2 family [Methylobacterium phyllostachyos]|uniref:Glycosyltransferase, GT2 family n=1 Tax=Methylobacterium phyllostachyos TaxID=582672 RepID=A0A1G9Z483_9HYPH|nr:glycosyltransferase [Methylobacterium phyllostachyos]SDN15476.1 Glycosyltransferase, GT2 family [Methylobacterium phyllostachyos]
MTRVPNLAAATPDAVIAVPVRNEEERIAACLRAIDAQVGHVPGSLGLVLFLNNCTDRTVEIVTALVPSLSLPVRVLVENFAGAHAGWARRRAMDAAAAWLEDAGQAGIILSTDADSRVPTDWVARNRAAIRAGADAVAGRVELDAAEAALLPPSLPARGRLEDLYDALITEAEARIDPDPHDPWPCHRTAIGATLAVTRSAYRAVGGMPEIPLGEDGAFIARLITQGLRVRHATDVCVTISARLAGRAPGGVADTIRARCEEPDALCDARMEAFPRAVRRYLWRRRFRRLHNHGLLDRSHAWARSLRIGADDASRIAALPLGHAIAEAERISPRLAYRPIGPSRLPREIRIARVGVAVIRLWETLSQSLSRTIDTAPAQRSVIDAGSGRG